MRATDLSPPPSPGASGGWGPPSDLRATVYGPAVLGTMKVDDPRAIAALAGLAPAIPRPPPVAAPPPARRPRLVAIGLALAPLPPLGLVLSTVALAGILARRPRPPGEAAAVLGVVLGTLALVVALVLAAG